MTELFNQQGLRLFQPSRSGEIAPSKCVVETLGLKKVGENTAARHYDRLCLIIRHLATNNRIFKPLLMPDEASFKEERRNLLEKLRQESVLQTLTLAIGFPILIPKITIRHYGRSLFDLFFPLLGESIEQFTSAQGAAQTLITPAKATLTEWRPDKPFFLESRYADIITKLANKYVVAIFFPALPGFSLKTALTQMSNLPNSLILSGAATTAFAMAMWPELIRFKWMCSAIRHEHDDTTVCFEPRDKTTIFQPTEQNMYINGIQNVHSGLLYI